MDRPFQPQNYRGRRSLGTRIAIVLLVLILVASCGFIFAQQYISYADDGRIYLELPYFGRIYLPTPERPPEEEEDQGPPPMQLVIDAPEDQEPVSESEPEPEPEPVEVFGPHHLVELAAVPADGMELTAVLREIGASGFVCTVRDNTGKLYWNSPTGQSKAVADDPNASQTIQGICESEDTLAVARFNVLHDSYFAAANMVDAAICQSNNYVWYDNHSYHWLEPEKELARQYVTGLAVECAELGFDELLLEELCYPTRGNTYKISYKNNTMEKNEALQMLLTEMKTALEPYGTKISLLLTQEQILAGSDAESGVDMAMLLPLVDGVYCQVSDPEAVQAAMEAVPGETPVLVYMEGDPGTVENWCVSAG